ncbi:cardiolipin synthase [Vagococcus penaei]|uniref:Cardiolipin synthase n=1 Tax=Vagococcus penaei TaxID=633807 RepID=A0A1Q2D474_9ENTE|nr:cardiolipin synthase [Vagococcus penaei]AQP53194.1 cardiolipin synthase [Vagococcus penaei]RSU00996.1 cardiolipin synthase [Vagococcus penaei]
MNKLLKILTNRAIIVGLLMVIQLAVLFSIVYRFSEYFVYFYFIYLLISVAVILKIINSRSNPAYKIAWLIPIMILPVFGTIIYLVFGRIRFSSEDKREMLHIQSEERRILRSTCSELRIEDNIDAQLQVNYLAGRGESTLFNRTTSHYFPFGEDVFVAMLEEIEKAEHYIFMEYFIVQEGYMWDTLLEALVKKVNEGVEVRFIYDDLGCLFTLPANYDKKLKSLGIKCGVFNQFSPILSSIFNNRNHRKITVIDGKVAFTGGINLADEYINKIERFGHWKDNGILLRGEAAWGFTLLFLSLWRFVDKTSTDNPYDYRPDYRPGELPESIGYYLPYVDSPFDKETVGMNVYLNLISRAKESIYITTPYLIIDNTLTEALSNAAKSGIDVRIITPHIPDKWYVHEITRSNYARLIEVGIKIFEYTPGFIHSKTFVVDGEYATVGTVNLDYRSLFLHFECGVWMYQTESVVELLKDHLATEEKSQLITLKEAKNVPWFKKVLRAVIGVFSPLL